jgi:hypothetical protein
MTIEIAEDALNTAYNAAIGPAGLNLPIAWDNTEFETISAAAAEWSAFLVEWVAGTTPELSATNSRYFGILTAQIFVPATTGKRRARQIAEVVLNAFTGKTIGGARVQNVGIADVGVTERWYQSNVTAELTLDINR